MEIVLRCVGCHAFKVVGREQKDQPLCDECSMPMIVVRAAAGKGEK